MALTMSTTDILSRDIAIAIKHFCFNNITEFYRRYEDEIGMSKATFHRIIQGDYASNEKIENVVILAKKLGLMLSEKEGCEWLVKKNLTENLVRQCQALVDNPSISNLGKMKEFLDKYKLGVLS